MTAPLRIAVVGVGAFGERHLAAYARQPGVEIVAVADRDRERAAAVAARWSVPHAFADGEELVAALRPDGISLVTPGPDHCAATVAALELGCSVLVEKPLAMTSEEVAAIAAAAARSPATVVPAHLLRFAAPYIALRDQVRAGAVGELLSISACRDRTRRHAAAYGEIHPALMTMVHDIDLAHWISGARARRVAAHQRGVGERGGPLVVWATVEADDGAIWSLHVSWLLPDAALPGDRFTVHGSVGMAALALEPTVTVLAADPGGVERLEPIDHELTPATVAGAIDAEVAHFCDCLRRRAPSEAVPLEAAAHGIAVAEAVIASAAAEGSWREVA